MASNIIDFQAALRRKAAENLQLTSDRLDRPSELENAALRFFEVITDSLERGVDSRDIDRLSDRLDRILGAL
jgi:hypothetical protein